MTTAISLIRRVAATAAIALLCTQPASIFAQERATGTPATPAAGEVLSEPEGIVAEPRIITRATIFADRHFGSGDRPNGFYIDFENMIPGAGWISGGPGYRRWSKKDQLFVDASTAISWHGYKTAQARLELPKIARSRLALGTQVRWQDFTQIDYFGGSAETVPEHRAEYRLKSTEAVGYATVRPVEWLGFGANVGWLKPEVLPRGGTFKSDHPDVSDLFPGDLVFALAEQPGFLYTEGSITADTRNFPGHPTRGILLRAAASNFEDQDENVFDFRRYEAEGAGFLPLAGSRIVLALHGWLVASDTSPGDHVPFYLLPSLGGHNSLRAYEDYRFHDRNLLLVNAETRIAMMTHVDAAVFFDAGNVAPRVGDLNLDKTSYGIGFRLHSRRQTFARLDVARGDEGWRIVLRLTDPLNLSRLSRHTAPVPFVP